MIAARTAVGRREAIGGLEDLFVSIDCKDDVAYVVLEGGEAMQWQEIPRSEAELLVRVGARSELYLRSGMRIGIVSDLGAKASTRWSS